MTIRLIIKQTTIEPLYAIPVFKDTVFHWNLFDREDDQPPMRSGLVDGLASKFFDFDTEEDAAMFRLKYGQTFTVLQTKVLT